MNEKRTTVEVRLSFSNSMEPPYSLSVQLPVQLPKIHDDWFDKLDKAIKHAILDWWEKL